MRRRTWKSKKGMSLVELIAVMAISVVVVGAALTALYGGSRSTTDGAADYGNHSDAQLLESWLQTNLPTVKKVAAETGIPHGVAGYTLFFTGGTDHSFEVAKNGASVLRINGIESVAVSTENVGLNQTFRYRITAEGGGRTFVLSGGIVLNNIPAAVSPASPAIPSEITYNGSASGYLVIA